MSHQCDILIITPPRRAPIWNVIAGTHPPRTQGIDSIPLRLAAVLEQQFAVAFLPLYHLLYNYYQLDARFISQYLQRYNPKIVIIASDYFISNRSTACFPAALEIAELCKTILPDVRVVMTGKHVITRPLEAFYASSPATDLVIAAEPENFICEVISSLLSGKIKPLQSFPGVIFRNDGEIFQSTGDVEPPDVNALPPPAYHLLWEHLPLMLEREAPYSRVLPLTIRTSYGCPYRCPYCAGTPNWNRYRLRHTAGVAEDLDAANTALGQDAEFIFLDDETFSYDENHVREISSVFASRKITLEGVLTHVKHFDAETARAIAQFSRSVIFGAENFSNTVLYSLGKGQTRESVLHACRLAKEAGLQTRLEFIAGLPAETPATMVENLNYIYNALSHGWIDQISPYVLTMHPGTAYCESASHFGINILHTRYEEYIEEGGFPAYKTNHLTQTQIFLYYLLVRQVCGMAVSNRRLCEREMTNPPHAGFDTGLFTTFLEGLGKKS